MEMMPVNFELRRSLSEEDRASANACTLGLRHGTYGHCLSETWRRTHVGPAAVTWMSLHVNHGRTSRLPLGPNEAVDFVELV